MKMKGQNKPSKYSENFKRIKASPERVAKAIMSSPARKSGEWKYQNRKSAQ